MKTCVISPQINGFDIDSDIGALIFHLCRLLRDMDQEVILLYSGQSQATMDPAWATHYRENAIDIQRLTPPAPGTFTTFFDIALRSERLLSALPSELDCIYCLEWQADLFHLVRQKRFSQERPPLVATILSNGSPWRREANLHYASAQENYVDGINDYMEAYVRKYSDVIIALDRYGIDWLTRYCSILPPEKNIKLLGYPYISPVVTVPMSSTQPVRRIMFYDPHGNKESLQIFLDALGIVMHNQDAERYGLESVTLIINAMARASGTQDIAEFLAQLGLNEELAPLPRYFELSQVLASVAADTLVVFGEMAERFMYNILDATNIGGLRFICPDVGAAHELVADPHQLFTPNVVALARIIGDQVRQPVTTPITTAGNQKRSYEAWHTFQGKIERKIKAMSQQSLMPSPQARQTDGAVDVCIPYYNLGAYLSQLLLSLEDQTSDDFNVFVIDDGSTDPEAQRIFQQLATHYAPRGWHFVSQTNRYLAATRNAGARLGHAHYICFIDADDVAGPTMIERMLTSMQQSDDDCLSCYYQLFDGDEFPYDRDSGQPLVPSSRHIALPGGGLTAAMLFNVLGGGCCIVKRTVFAALGGFREHRFPYEDLEFHARLQLSGYTDDIIPEPLLFYRQIDKSMVHTTTPAMNYRGLLQVEQAFRRALKPLGLEAVPDTLMGLYAQLYETQSLLNEREQHLATVNLELQVLQQQLTVAKGTAQNLEQELINATLSWRAPSVDHTTGIKGVHHLWSKLIRPFKRVRKLIPTS